jgi:hypothetical protein
MAGRQVKRALFIGGPINNQVHEMPEPYPEWNVPVAPDLNPMALEAADPSESVTYDTYHYERQHYFASDGSWVYICTSRSR